MNDLIYPADENINWLQPLKDNSFIIYKMKSRWVTVKG